MTQKRRCTKGSIKKTHIVIHFEVIFNEILPLSLSLYAMFLAYAENNMILISAHE